MNCDWSLSGGVGRVEDGGGPVEVGGAEEVGRVDAWDSEDAEELQHAVHSSSTAG